MSVPVNPQHVVAQLENQRTRVSSLEESVGRIEGGMNRHEKRLDRIENKLDEHTIILDEHTRILDEHTRILDEHTRLLEEHSSDLTIIKQTLAEHSTRFNVLEDKMDAGFAKIDLKFERVFQLLGA